MKFIFALKLIFSLSIFHCDMKILSF